MKSMSDFVNEMQQDRARILETVATWSAEQGAFKPHPEAWSASEVLEHLYASEFIVMNVLWSGIDGLRINSPIWNGEHTNRGLSVEAVVVQFESGKFKSHPATEVKIGGALAFWAEALDSCQPMLERLASALQNVDAGAIVFPHFIAGPMDANQWIPFMRLHLNRHRAQIERLRTMPGFPG
jgi:hypothetical protein